MAWQSLRSLPLCVFAAGVLGLPCAAMSVKLSASADSPVPLGTPIRWTASVANADAGTLWYRFRVGRSGAQLRIVRDYSPLTSLDWHPYEHEGTYQVEV